MSPGRLGSLLRYGTLFACAVFCADMTLLKTGPWLELSSPECHLGLMTVGTESFAEITLRNTGWRSSVILTCHASCGCSRVELSQREISPGESAVLRATVTPNPTQRPGEISVLTIRTDGALQPEIRIPVVTDGVAGLRLVPASLDFGSVPMTSLPSVMHSRMIFNSGVTRDATVMRNLTCRVDDPRLSVRVSQSSDREPGIEVELKGGIPAGDYWTHVTVSDDQGRFLATAPVHAQVLGEYYAHPGALILDSGNMRDCTAGRRVRISRRIDGTSDGVIVTNVTLPKLLDQIATVEWEACNILIKIRADAPSTSFQSRLQQSATIEVRDASLTSIVLNLPLVVTVRSNPGNAL